MSTEYTKTNWQDGDIITADKMNNIENGIKGIEEATTHVKDEFNNTIFEGENFTRGKFLDSNGTETDNADWCITAYVPVTAGERITTISPVDESYRQAWILEYDSNKAVVDYWGVPKTSTGRNVELSASTAYIRMGFVLGNDAKILNQLSGVVIWKAESDGLLGAKEDIKALNADMSQAFTASRKIYATFHAGLASSDGTINASAPTYANATDIISYPYELLITAEKGYRFFLQLFNSNDSYLRTIGWMTGSYQLSANQKFMITVAQSPEDTTYNAKENEFRLGVTIGRVHSQWEGKKWLAFGTSISDTTFPMPYDLPGMTGKYPPFLTKLSGLIHYNYALGGSRITNEATSDRDTILRRILDTDLSDADLITIDLPVNDFGACAIGTLETLTPETATDATLYGAMFLAITHCLENSNAVVCLITDNTGKLWTTPSGTVHPIDRRPWVKDGNGKTQDDYCDAMRKIATYLGCYCIDAGSMASINYCHPEYLQDQIHQSVSGGEQYANAIWSVLKDIQPNVTR